MNDVKEKIRAMMKEETATQRREKLNGHRGKKTKNKKSKEKIAPLPMDEEKKKLIRNIFLVIILIISALGLFYAASINKQSAQNKYQQQLEAKAKQELATLLKQSTQILNHKHPLGLKR